MNVNRQENLILIFSPLIGFEADIAGNGKEAIAGLENNNYNLIPMVCHMPEMDGTDKTIF